MKRESVNPWDWGLQFDMDQGELVEGLERYLHFSGQVSVVPDAESDLGFAIRHAGDIRGQMQLSLSNIVFSPRTSTHSSTTTMSMPSGFRKREHGHRNRSSE